MKILNMNVIAQTCLLIIVCLAITTAGCSRPSAPKVKSPKVDDPVEISTTCAQNLGIVEEDTKALVKALERYDGKITDEFKLRAFVIISESDYVDPENSEAILKSYFACLESYTAEKK